MLAESTELLLGPLASADDAVFVDATFGAGGHSQAILARLPRARLVALDADPAAVQRAERLAGRERGRIVAVHRNFAELAAALDEVGVNEVSGILYDLGLSSLQLADPARGFSFSADAPLDMRYDPTEERPTAADLLAALDESELSAMLFEYGGERFARRIARQIVRQRQQSPLKRTGDVVAAVLSAVPAAARRGRRIHPATRTFQALRIAVNDELANLERSLEAAKARTRCGARIVVIAFHSGEDRVAKRRFAAWRADGSAALLTPKPLRPTSSETRANPRSRSAKLRAVERRGRPNFEVERGERRG